MSESSERAAHRLETLLQGSDLSELEAALESKPHLPDTKIPGSFSNDQEAIERRRKLLNIEDEAWDHLTPSGGIKSLGDFSRNIENLIGSVHLPLGIAGPLRVNGTCAQGDYLIPLATHEAALVASYHRGMLAITESGGSTAILLNEGVSRSPGFIFENLIEAGKFLAWATPQQDHFREVAESTTHHGKLVGTGITVEGNHVYFRFDYHTGDAAGQNMVTIATQAICDYIEKHSPVRPKHMFVEANQSGDKKASSQSFQHVRGKKVTCETILSPATLKTRLRVTALQMAEYWRMSALGGVLSGTVGVQGHYANGLAALFIACGQDAACVAEAAVGLTRFEAKEDGSLYAAVTLPNLIVGTVGGGTGLPSSKACLEMMGLYGDGKARAFAEVCAATVLAGELSIIAALASGNFSRAHQVLARLRKK